MGTYGDGRQRNSTYRGMFTHIASSTYDDAMCVKVAVEINVLDYNVAVCRRT